MAKMDALSRRRFQHKDVCFVVVSGKSAFIAVGVVTALHSSFKEDLPSLPKSVQPTTPSAYQRRAMRDRALGALVGLAVGDAVGTTLEFKARDSYQPLVTMIGGGPFDLKPGEFTDDTSMALALADSLLTDPELDAADLMTRFVAWRDDGEYSCVGHCFDIGNTVDRALDQWLQTGNPVAGSTHPNTAGNGSLMRLAPVALVHWPDRAKLAQVASRQSITTHAAPEAVSACVGFASVLADAYRR